jgi:LPS-assembly protein
MLVLGQPSPAQILPTGTPVVVKADVLHADIQDNGTVYHLQRLTTEGDCSVRSVSAYVRADKIRYDETTGFAVAEGHAMAISGTSALVGDAMEVNVVTGEMRPMNSLFMGKKGVSPKALEAAETPMELKQVGTTAFVATADGIRQIDKDHLSMDGVEMVPCDCDPLDPHWSIKSFKSNITVGDHAWLWAPVIYIYKVPVLPLPVMYVPLNERQSGLLVTKPHFSGQSGFGLEQPVFFTLGRSYDLTATPGYYWGNPPFTTVGAPPKSTPSGAYFFGLQGPVLGLDFRYVPSTHTTGELTLGLVDDLRPSRVPIPLLDPAYNGAAPVPASEVDPERKLHRGVRTTLNWHHDQDLGNGVHDRVDASLLSDGYLLSDVTTDVLQRANEYVTSAARLYRATDESYVGADLRVRQDVRFGYSLLPSMDQTNWTIPNLPLHAPNTLQRLPGVTYNLPQAPLWGPVWGGLNLSYVRLAGLYGERENDAPYNYLAPYSPVPLGIYPQVVSLLGTRPTLFPTGPYLPGNGQFPEIGLGEARDRLDVNPTVSAEWGDSFIHLRPYAAWREDLYVGEVTGDIAQRGYLLGGIQLSSELSRVFSTASGPLRNNITPSLDLRYVPFVLGNPLNLYDEVDRAIPYNPLATNQSAGLSQAVAQVSTTLAGRQGKVGTELVRLDVGQEINLRHLDNMGDTFALLRGRVGGFTSEAGARYNTQAERLAQAWVMARVTDTRKDSVDARYDGVLFGGSDRQRAGVDELVGSPYPDPATVRALPFANQIHLGLTGAVIGGLFLRYDMLLQTPGATLEVPSLTPAFTFPNKALNLAEQYVAVDFAPACNCWRVELAAYVVPQRGANPNQVNLFGTVDFRFNLTISNFGSFGN